MIKYAYTILYVQDVARSIDFYEKAFGFKRKFITPEHDYGELITGDTTLSFASLDLANSNLSDGFMACKPENKPFGIEIGLVTDDVDSVIEKALKMGATLFEEPRQKPWGQTVAYIKDLDGFLIEICTPMG